MKFNKVFLMIISLLLLQHYFHDFSVETLYVFKVVFAFSFKYVCAIELTLQEFCKSFEFSQNWRILEEKSIN